MKRISSGPSRVIHQVTASVIIATCFLLLAGPAHAISVARKKHLSLEQYHKAIQLREALNGRPEAQRTAEDYERVIDAFRKVYHVAPTSTRADASVLAVGDLLTEKARLDNDEQGFKAAIGQYEFLAREYPGSKYRFEALLSVGQIYREDLGDNDAAKASFEDFLKHYPRHPLADNARAALREMEDEAQHPARKNKDQAASLKRRESPQQASEEDDDAQPAPVKTTSAKHKGLPLVTSLRYWSTPDYTRIAIDVGDEIKYEAGRVPSPDRIYFDLYGSRLASELMGKSYNIEDGLLKKVRVAQYKPNMARIVLEVDNLAEYSAFLLPNPYRLIIDVHGKKPARQVETAKAEDSSSDGNSNSLTGVPQSRGSKRSQQKTAASAVNSAQTNPSTRRQGDRRADAIAVSAKAELPPRAEVPLQSSDLGLAEIAALSEDPEQVKATSKPTSGPVVESVSKRAPEKKVIDDEDDTSTSTPLTSSKNTRKTGKTKPAVTAASVHTAAPTADGDLSLIRALGLKIGRIVVDAGHGGHDTGTIGPNGLLEKDLVLDVALRLGKLLEQKLGAEVVYTRHDDTFIPLETRTAIANQNQADLFISIHANSSRDTSARGVETYYLNFTRSPEALEVAARENAVSETSVHDLQDLVKKIALKEKIDESREFAATVQRALYTGESSKNPGVKNRGVKKAPFIVLIGANMPSILAEISFVSNPTDERKLRTPEYRQRIAESLYRGVARYAQGLSGVKVASAKQSETRGQ
ncbi:MAG TPA: N-acetylmuramoyl-L-alanine amidase [Terriglobales bacterium]|nr:N-acetylmuramoyl-L-alanine amidase [Terriglobales bacterium]